MAAQPVRGVKRLMLGVLLAAGGTVALSNWAEAAPPADGAPPPAYGAHGAHAGPRGGEGFGVGPGLFMGRPEHTDRAVDHLLRGLNATEQQRSQIQQIARAAAADLHAQHEAARGQHEQGLQLFAAPVVDARAVEALRQQRLAQHDQASKRITQAMLDVAAVLSPEQRATLVARAREREQRMKEHRQHDRRGAASAPAR